MEGRLATTEGVAAPLGGADAGAGAGGTSMSSSLTSVGPAAIPVRSPVGLVAGAYGTRAVAIAPNGSPAVPIGSEGASDHCEGI